MKLTDLDYNSPTGQETQLLACGCDDWLSNGDQINLSQLGLHVEPLIDELAWEEQFVDFSSYEEAKNFASRLRNLYGFQVEIKRHRVYYS